MGVCWRFTVVRSSGVVAHELKLLIAFSPRCPVLSRCWVSEEKFPRDEAIDLRVYVCSVTSLEDGLSCPRLLVETVSLSRTATLNRVVTNGSVEAMRYSPRRGEDAAVRH